jgi:hypothetical protein
LIQDLWKPPSNQVRFNTKPIQPVPSAHPEAVERLKNEFLEKTRKLLSLCSPHLLNTNKTVPFVTQEKLCGRVFYPRDFAELQVSIDYDLNATGNSYFATAIGLHHVTFDDTTSSQQARHNLIYNSMMKCGSSSVNRALQELPKASQEYFPDANNKMKVIHQGKQNNLMAIADSNASLIPSTARKPACQLRMERLVLYHRPRSNETFCFSYCPRNVCKS